MGENPRKGRSADLEGNSFQSNNGDPSVFSPHDRTFYRSEQQQCSTSAANSSGVGDALFCHAFGYDRDFYRTPEVARYTSRNSSGLIHQQQLYRHPSPHISQIHGGHNRQVPQIQSFSPEDRIHMYPSAIFIDEIDEQYIIDKVSSWERNINIRQILMGPQESFYSRPLFSREDTRRVTNALTEDLISRHLKTRTLVPKRTSKDDICSICQDNSEENCTIGTLDCGHFYHVDCITKWLKIKNQCPLCKKTGLSLNIP